MAARHSIGRRRFLSILGGGAAALSALGVQGQTPHPRKKPNILFIFSDDHALRTIGAYGSGFHKTPNIDRLAEQGAVFTRSFCCNSICQPSRAAILTGKHSHLNGVTDNGKPWNPKQMVVTRLLRNAGYQTALFGKWHMHPIPSDEFDTWEVLAGAGGQGRYYNPEFDTRKGRVSRKGYATDLITDRSIKWLKAERDPSRPFFLMCQYKAPHVPRMPPLRMLDRYRDAEIPEPETLFDDYATRHHAADAWMMVGKQEGGILNIYPPMDRVDLENKRLSYLAAMTPEQRDPFLAAYAGENADYRRRREVGELKGRDLERYHYQRFIKDYLRIVDAIDENVGRLLAHLDEQDLARDTVVIYSSDQGYFTGEHGYAEKRWMYEESLAMPFVIRWPGGVKPGIRPDAMIQNIDYAPTFLELAGVPVPDEMQGRSLVPLFKGERPRNWRRIVYYHYYAHGKHNVPRHDGVRTEKYKLIHYYTDDTWEMFDLTEDPNEMRNLYKNAAKSRLRERLRKELARLRRMYAVPRPPEAKVWP